MAARVEMTNPPQTRQPPPKIDYPDLHEAHENIRRWVWIGAGVVAAILIALSLA